MNVYEKKASYSNTGYGSLKRVGRTLIYDDHDHDQSDQSPMLRLQMIESMITQETKETGKCMQIAKIIWIPKPKAIYIHRTASTFLFSLCFLSSYAVVLLQKGCVCN